MCDWCRFFGVWTDDAAARFALVLDAMLASFGRTKPMLCAPTGIGPLAAVITAPESGSSLESIAEIARRKISVACDQYDLTALHAACDALRAKLQEVEDEGWVEPVEVRDAASQMRALPAPSLGLAALRIVLQHVCQADQAVLSARPDAPDQCLRRDLSGEGLFHIPFGENRYINQL